MRISLIEKSVKSRCGLAAVRKSDLQDVTGLRPGKTKEAMNPSQKNCLKGICRNPTSDREVIFFSDIMTSLCFAGGFFNWEGRAFLH